MGVPLRIVRALYCTPSDSHTTVLLNPRPDEDADVGGNDERCQPYVAFSAAMRGGQSSTVAAQAAL